jgi:hypothetical protein
VWLWTSRRFWETMMAVATANRSIFRLEYLTCANNPRT